jgi:hypothetical protein
MLAALPATNAGECTAASGPQRVAVLELYTSEGCDSCPPADKWVSELPGKKLTVDRLLPLAFHVDYWNQLGWTDPFSQANFSERQRQHSKRRDVSFVVTPQLLLNGQDYRRGALFDDIDGRVRTINQSKSLADIRIGISMTNTLLLAKVGVSVGGDAALKRAQVYLALYENNLATAVNAGENKGRTLKHDFVVRTLAGPLMLDGDGNLASTQRFPLEARWKPQDLHLAVFVQHPQSGDVLQALAATCR